MLKYKLGLIGKIRANKFTEETIVLSTVHMCYSEHNQ